MDMLREGNRPLILYLRINEQGRGNIASLKKRIVPTLDVFSHLEEAKTYIEIAEKLKSHPNDTKYFLDALA
jgi:hypothetical protein